MNRIISRISDKAYLEITNVDGPLSKQRYVLHGTYYDWHPFCVVSKNSETGKKVLNGFWPTKETCLEWHRAQGKEPPSIATIYDRKNGWEFIGNTDASDIMDFSHEVVEGDESDVFSLAYLHKKILNRRV